MKRFLSILLGVVLTCTLLAFVGCDDPETPPTPPAATYKFGAGVYTLAEESRGKIEVATNAAAVILEDDKIVAVAIDTAAYKNEDGVTLTDLRTKAEKGDDYGMANKGATKGEWYTQVDFFKGLVIGKTISEVEALMATDGYGTDVVKAGCTILVNGFVGAIKNAVANAVEVDVKDATLKIGTFVEAKVAATDTYVYIAAVKDGKIVAGQSDCVQGAFNTAVGEVLSKRQKGNNYGMSAIGKAEWFVQADAFDALCVGEAPADVANIASADVVAAGCTMGASGLYGAVAKIA